MKKWRGTIIRKLNSSREIAESALEEERFSAPFKYLKRFSEPSFE